MNRINRDTSILDAYRGSKQEYDEEEQERCPLLCSNYSLFLLILAIVIIIFVRIALSR